MIGNIKIIVLSYSPHFRWDVGLNAFIEKYDFFTVYFCNVGILENQDLFLGLSFKFYLKTMYEPWIGLFFQDHVISDNKKMK